MCGYYLLALLKDFLFEYVGGFVNCFKLIAKLYLQDIFKVGYLVEVEVDGDFPGSA